MVPIVAAAAALVLLAVAGGWLAAKARPGKATVPTFRRLTFRSGALHNARFTPDGQTIVYGATWLGETQSLFAVRPESPESRPFGFRADILAVSSAGEMAVMLDQNPVFGTLARVPFAGGVPRPAVEGVPYASADWSPDGKDLAVVRIVEGRWRLEFPLGKVLHEGPDINAPRFNAAGDRIAFFQRGKTGSVMVIRRSGEGVRTIANGFDLPGGAPCWTPNGKEVWFTGSRGRGQTSALYAADLLGRVRLVAQMPGELELDDISRDGRLLLGYHTLIGSMRGVVAGDPVERELTWLDLPLPADISADGKTILFTETGEGGGKTSGAYMRSLDGSPAVRLGDGHALALAPGGKSALVSLPGTADRLLLLPTAVGEPKTITLAGFETLDSAAFLPDGKEFVFSGKEIGKAPRTYRMSLQGGKPRPIGPEGIRISFRTSGPVSLDGKWMVGASGPRTWLWFSIEGGEARPIAGLEPAEYPIRWAPDRSLWVRHGISGEVTRLDPSTGRRTPGNKVQPPDATLGVQSIVMTPDGRTYVYSAVRAHSLLYVVEGLK